MFREKPYIPMMVEPQVEPEPPRYGFSRFPSKPEPPKQVFAPMPPADPNIPIHCGLQDEKAFPKPMYCTVRINGGDYILAVDHRGVITGDFQCSGQITAVADGMSYSSSSQVEFLSAEMIRLSNRVSSLESQPAPKVGVSAFPYPQLKAEDVKLRSPNLEPVKTISAFNGAAGTANNQPAPALTRGVMWNVNTLVWGGPIR